jgi:hypothetical protein
MDFVAWPKQPVAAKFRFDASKSLTQGKPLSGVNFLDGVHRSPENRPGMVRRLRGAAPSPGRGAREDLPSAEFREEWAVHKRHSVSATLRRPRKPETARGPWVVFLWGRINEPAVLAILVRLVGRQARRVVHHFDRARGGHAPVHPRPGGAPLGPKASPIEGRTAGAAGFAVGGHGGR